MKENICSILSEEYSEKYRENIWRTVPYTAAAQRRQVKAVRVHQRAHKGACTHVVLCCLVWNGRSARVRRSFVFASAHVRTHTRALARLPRARMRAYVRNRTEE